MKPSLCLAESINLALRVLQAALDRAMALSVRVSIVVVDAAGLPIHTAHMDSAPLQCRDIAPNKAPTAVVGVPTRVWEERLAGMSDAACQGLPLQPRMALFGGKEPFPFEGVAVGAISISGTSEQQDEQCAQAAARAVLALLDAPSA
ncbi:GlcG/HbpS family heme-binding protein [Azorhizophilus paspali]|uniref:Heme-binding protein n=1 Tax=Azorhizophilus paspali TaxID=69963 RepID=A0ABV6SJF2_AZOPA